MLRGFGYLEVGSWYLMTNLLDCSKKSDLFILSKDEYKLVTNDYNHRLCNIIKEHFLLHKSRSLPLSKKVLLSMVF
jgi:hypothetical protein